MGSGSSAKQTHCIEVGSAPQAIRTVPPDSPGSYSTNRDEEVRWLRQKLDQEKGEKSWMMERFDALERELKSRNEECGNLRAQVMACKNQQLQQSLEVERQSSKERVVSKACNYVERSSLNEALAAMEPPAFEVAKSAPPATSPPRKSEKEPTSPSSPVSPGSGLSLKERRGLKFSGMGINTQMANEGLETKAAVEAAPVPTVVVSQPVDKVEFGPNENAPAVLPSPLRKSTQAHNNPIEPMSPLLARRRSSSDKKDASKYQTSPAAISPRPNEGVAREVPPPVTQRPRLQTPMVLPSPKASEVVMQAGQPSMRIEACKIDSADDLVPASPKRAKRRNPFDDEPVAVLPSLRESTSEDAESPM